MKKTLAFLVHSRTKTKIQKMPSKTIEDVSWIFRK